MTGAVDDPLDLARVLILAVIMLLIIVAMTGERK